MSHPDEVDSLVLIVLERYRTVENSENPGGLVPPLSWTADDIEAWLLDQAFSVAGGKTIFPDSNIFDEGFDRFVSRIYYKKCQSCSS